MFCRNINHLIFSSTLNLPLGLNHSSISDLTFWFSGFALTIFSSDSVSDTLVSAVDSE